jgi:hypothetical protein
MMRVKERISEMYSTLLTSDLQSAAPPSNRLLLFKERSKHSIKKHLLLQKLKIMSYLQIGNTYIIILIF